MAPLDAYLTAGLNAARALAGRPVIVRTGPPGSPSATVQALPHGTIDNADPDRGLVRLRGMRDWVLYVPDLIFDGVAEFPALGWEIDTMENGQTLTYRVLPPNPNDDIHERVTPDQNWLLVHTKLVAGAPG